MRFLLGLQRGRQPFKATAGHLRLPWLSPPLLRVSGPGSFQPTKFQGRLGAQRRLKHERAVGGKIRPSLSLLVSHAGAGQPEQEAGSLPSDSLSRQNDLTTQDPTSNDKKSDSEAAEDLGKNPAVFLAVTAALAFWELFRVLVYIPLRYMFLMPLQLLLTKVGARPLPLHTDSLSHSIIYPHSNAPLVACGSPSPLWHALLVHLKTWVSMV